jgi:parallel beta-helix repeat protein
MVGWSWGYNPSTAHDNLIEWNHIHHSGNGILSDLGGIYLLGRSPGTVIRFNKVHDSIAFWEKGHGIYLDEGVSEVLVENNVVYNNMHASFFSHYGRSNIIRNNIFAYSTGDLAVLWHYCENRLSDFSFYQNVVVASHRFFGADYWCLGSFWDNLYWSPNGHLADTFPNPELVFNSTNPDSHCTSSWKTWTKSQDRTSIIADPMLSNSFTMDASSPAISKLGFKPLNDVVEKAGPTIAVKEVIQY